MARVEANNDTAVLSRVMRPHQKLRWGFGHAKDPNLLVDEALDVLLDLARPELVYIRDRLERFFAQFRHRGRVQAREVLLVEALRRVGRQDERFDILVGALPTWEHPGTKSSFSRYMPILFRIALQKDSWLDLERIVERAWLRNPEQAIVEEIQPGALALV
jgi:hypothetical protein